MEEFEKYVKYFSMNNQYDIDIQKPNISELPSTPDLQSKLRVFARNTSIPSQTLENYVSRVANIKKATPIQIDVDSFSVTFFDTNSLFFHTYFNTWMNARFNKAGAIKYYINDFSSEAEFKHYDKKVYKAEGLYPISVGDYRLDTSIDNTFGTFDVTFYVKKLTTLTKDFSNVP